MAWPTAIRINAFTGTAGAGSALHPDSKRWAGASIEVAPRTLKARGAVNLRNWRHDKVGWGLVLPENPDLDPAERATADDAPVPIRRLVAARGNAPVLRYSRRLPKWAVRRYYPDGSCQDASIVSSTRGVGYGEIPRYLLIYAPPATIPWEFQYLMNAMAFVGRLDLEGQALENYIEALLDNWDNAESDVSRAVVWAVDHGGDDITRLMRRAIAKKVHAGLADIDDIGAGAVYIDGKDDPATHQKLVDALQSSRPALVVTTSHGMTGPLNNLEKMRTQLGLLVDGDHQILDVAELVENWNPDGAIWYAQACCSAGSDASTSYAGLVDDSSHVATVLNGVAKLGATVAPFPRALLGAHRPLRAFLGHVEPTFDWTIRQKETNQFLTGSVVAALCGRLSDPMPVGLAFDECHQQAPKLDTIHKLAISAFNAGEDRLGEALACRLMAADWQSLVILGDPTVALPWPRR